MATREPIAIIGSGFRFPGNANSPSALWDLLLNPRDLSVPIPEERFSTRGFYHENGQHHGHTNVDRAYLLAEEGIERKFDAQFFGISASEANVIDPQVRLLLETVFEALEAAGQTMDSLEGSNTAVYSGSMVADYEHIMNRDELSMGKYHITGTARSLMSNRVSYFFDWHGPSITIDTACSSSLVAVHYAVQQLRSGESRIAIATGSNLLLDPIGFIGESKLQMLSPDGQSRMWDATANGYARGEGVAAIVLKTLSAAEADGDIIECIIRETAINQDGKTRGITMPSPPAQANLIRDCYRKAGLDIDTPAGRPQYFEAHGTGTPSGDPVEAEAISNAFFGNSGTNSRDNLNFNDTNNFHTNNIKDVSGPLFVGSIKTVVGHTEGTAGLAGLLKTCLALKHSIIPPNLLFDRLNPNISPFFKYLCIPVHALPWPSIPEGSTRRASVNSFGFGGSNAHAILENYTPCTQLHRTPVIRSNEPLYFPFIFSAASEISLAGNLEAFCNYVKANETELDLRALSFTLHSRRTRFPLAVCVSASTAAELIFKIQHVIQSAKAELKPLWNRARQAGVNPRILAIFTGQGAQWARMGANLISSSACARSTVGILEARLACLPPQDRPSWSLIEELQKDVSSSNISLAALSQPLCTAVQILLVDLLRAAGVTLTASVGHSSGEVAAAYAAGILSAEDAICIAYYRGLHACLAQGSDAKTGSMMAVGSSLEDVQALLSEPEYEGRVCVAAVNSSTSITISGDSEAIEELEVVFRDEKTFARPLRVDRAYHSHHMLPCSASLVDSLQKLNIKPRPSYGCDWFSTTCVGAPHLSSMEASYWSQNMVNPVLFMQGLQAAYESSGPFDMAIEIGPHPALKGPALQTVNEVTGHTIPYTGLLRRGCNDLEVLAESLGSIATHLGKTAVDFQAYEQFVVGSVSTHMATELPTYSWNHENEYWHESRHAKAIRGRTDPVHELLGHLCPDSTEYEMKWRNLLSPKEIPWLKGHQLQNQIIFPAAGYVVTALEASLSALQGASVSTIEIYEFEIDQPLFFKDDTSSVEVVVSLSIVRKESSQFEAIFRFSGATGTDGMALESLASGRILVCLGNPSPDSLPARGSRPSNLLPVKAEVFYDTMAELGYQYSDHFVALSGLERRLGAATGFISDMEDSKLLIHPTVLDGAFQAVILAASAPGDGKLSSIHVPTGIRRMIINPSLCLAASSSEGLLSFDAYQPEATGLISGDVDIFPATSIHAMVQVEGLQCVPLSPSTVKDDKILFSSTVWGLALPNAQVVVEDGHATQQQYNFACLMERAACFYLRNLDRDVPSNHSARFEGPYTALFGYASHALAKSRQLNIWSPEWELDTFETIQTNCSMCEALIDFRLLRAVGEKLTDIVMHDTPAIEIGMKDGLLSQFYQRGFGMSEYVRYLARTVKQIVHQSPHIRCLEIGAGTGAATKAIFDEMGDTVSSYTFTDVSAGFFDSARASLGSCADRMLFKVLDITKDPSLQGFEPHSYDLIVASMVFHATPSLNQTLSNARRLLRPGGHLVVLEIHESPPARIGTVFGAFPGWWLGVAEGRILSPCISTVEWDELLRQTGFSGVDTATPDLDPLVQPMTLFVSQATDSRMDFLRDPLACSSQLFNPGTVLQDLVLLGGESLRTAKLAAQLECLLQQYCGKVRRAKSLAQLQGLGITSITTVLALTDLDDPFFKIITQSKWDNLKWLLEEAGSILWITQGRRADEPFSNMIVGLLRCAVIELPGLDLQCLDIEEPQDLDARTIGEALLQFKAAKFWKRDDSDDDICLTIEPELVVEKGGNLVIPRLQPEQAMNDRYNSSRRKLLCSTSLHDHVVEVLRSTDNWHLRRELEIPGEIQTAGAQVHVSHSILDPISIFGRDYLYLSVGVLQGPMTRCLALSLKNSSVVNPKVFLSLSQRLPTSAIAKFLYLVNICGLAFEILLGLGEGDKVLVHEPECAMIPILNKQAHCRGIKTVFTTSSNVEINGCLRIHPSAPDRTLRNVKPISIKAFYDFSTNAESKRVAERLRAEMPNIRKYKTIETMFRHDASVSTIINNENIQRWLEAAMMQAKNHLASASSTELPRPTIRTCDISEINQQLLPHSVLEWTRDDPYPTKVEPIDSQLKLSGNKTYWLVGLTGTLGLSLCRWMILHGARYVALSSRSPHVEASWLAEMKSFGAVVQIYACDVTNKQDLAETLEIIQSTMPPIAGVAQGAMVLHDVLLTDMSFDTLGEVTRPKVEGSVHLSDMFSQNTLEFFVFFSSISSVVGNYGQSSYAAANMFMVSLAGQRRQRGLAASVINIGPIIGAGYISERGLDTSAMSTRFASLSMSEEDFHQLFAEGIMAGHPQTSGSIEVSSGVRQVALDERDQPKWSSNPFMSHYLLDKKALDNVSNKRSEVSVRARLSTARHYDEVYQIVRVALLGKLGMLFQLDVDTMDQASLDATRIDELGLDSLIATEIRAWLMDNMGVNFPVLRILNGISVKDLVTATLEDIAPTLIPNAQLAVPCQAVPAIEISESEFNSSSLSDSLSIAASLPDSGYGKDISSNVSASGCDEDLPQTTYLEPVFPTTFDLSLSQEMFWLASKFFDDRTSQNIAGVARIDGPIRVREIREAVRSLTQQHDCFKTCFLMSDGKMIQGSMEQSSLELEYKRIFNQAEVDETVREIQQQVYGLEAGETVRIILLSLSSSCHFLVIGTTHLSMDGLSFQVLLRNLFRNYYHESHTGPILQYQEYVHTQKNKLLFGKLDKELRFWKDRFRDLPHPLPILHVSPIISRPNLTSFGTSTANTTIAPRIKSQIQLVCRKSRVTSFHFYLACLRALLSRYADAEDVVVGMGDANRSEHNMQNSIGVFVNVLPLRLHAKSSDRFEDLLQRVQEVTYEALENSQLPFQALVKELNPPRSANCTPIFQCLINYRPGLGKETFGECVVEYQSTASSSTAYDIILDIIDDSNGAACCKLTLRKDLYSDREAGLLMKSYEKLVEAFANEPGAALTKPGLYDDHEIGVALNIGQGTFSATRIPDTVIHLVDDITNAYPNDVAVRSNTGETTTYQELAGLSASIAAALWKNGAVIGSTIAVLLEPSPLWIASILAVMRIGAVLLPLDLSTPWTRLAAICAHCRPSYVLADAETMHRVHGLNQPDLTSIDVSLLDAEYDTPPIVAWIKCHAMILYTSGSSGIPKGIVLTHENIANQVEPTQRIYGLEREVVLQQSASSFDMAYAQIFTALCFGGTIVMLPRHLRGDAVAITDLIVSHNITHTFATPTEYSSWLRYGTSDHLRKTSWQTAICGGETVSNILLVQFRSLQKSDLRVFNGYGPTETFVVATAMQLDYSDPSSYHSSIGAGFVLPNYSVYIVDKNLNLVPQGVQGEIYIGGASVSVGYVRDPSKSSERFVPDPFATDEFKAKGWTKMHRVGDLGRWREDGSILIEGRISGDTQVKIRGIRMELREIENAILKAADGSFSEVVVSVRRMNAEAPEFLVAHVLFSHPREEGHGFLQSLLASLPLPKHMLPAAIIPLQHMPRTSSAKLDRRAIELLPLEEETEDDKKGALGEQELTHTEELLRHIWFEVIQSQVHSRHEIDITPETDFFNAGGSSLLLLELQERIRSTFQTKIPYHKLMESATLGSMACLISKDETETRKIINWDKETLVPHNFTQLPRSRPIVATPHFTVVLTGAAGYLGRALLDALIADEKVDRIHCIGIRGLSTRIDMMNLAKVHLYEGDLKLPRLGLSTDDAHNIFTEANCIIHNGAQVSHLQSYHSLKPPNVLSTHELVKMSLREGRRIPLHFISSAQVGTYYTAATGEHDFPEVTVSHYPPPTDGIGGYGASKWASEVFLERIQGEIQQARGDGAGWPVVIHRPALISRPFDKPALDIVHNIRYFSVHMRAVPILPSRPHSLGMPSIVPIEEVVAGIVGAVHEDNGAELGVRYRHYFGREAESLENLIMSHYEDGDMKSIEKLPPKEWARRAGELGMERTVMQWIEAAATEEDLQ